MADMDALLAEHGTTFADELGINVAKNTPVPLFELLIASLLLASRIQHRLAMQAYVELRKAGFRTADKLAAADAHDVWSALDRGDYLRKDRTTDLLQSCARQVADDYGGDLRRLREAADGDAGRMGELLQELKGFGETGAEIFLREVQVAWPEISPFYGSRAKEAARARRLPSSDGELAELGDPAVVGAALIRAQLSDG